MNNRIKNRSGGNLFIVAITVWVIANCLTSCTKVVTVDPPNSKIVTATLFTDNNTATAALTDIYTQMANNGESFNMAYNTGILSDELKNYSSAVQQRELYTNSMDANSITSDIGCWRNGYNYIYQANAMLSGLSTSTGISNVVKQQLSGEAKFVRAFWYFYLTNSYGEVPLALTTDYTVNSKLPRTDSVGIYRQIITDLINAKNLLNAGYVDISDTVNSGIPAERVRPNKATAFALLARAYLYTKQYDSASMAADSVINNSDIYAMEPNLNSVFLVAGSSSTHEAIWQLQTPTPYQGSNTSDGQHFVLIAKPGTGIGKSSISEQLLSAFEIGDARRNNWVHDTTFASAVYSYPYKYKFQSSATVTEYVMVCRLAEQYLIRAEAEAYGSNGGLSAAINDLNVIRNRAGLPNTTAVTQQDVLAAILHERQVEFFTEWGNRWFDLRRTGVIDNVMGVVTPLKGGTWDSPKDRLFPVPNSERLNDPNLTQNPGYN